MLRGRGGFLVSWFLVSWFLVYCSRALWFLDFLVSWFPGLKVSRFQVFENPLMLLRDIGSMLPNCHLMFF